MSDETFKGWVIVLLLIITCIHLGWTFFLVVITHIKQPPSDNLINEWKEVPDDGEQG